MRIQAKCAELRHGDYLLDAGKTYDGMVAFKKAGIEVRFTDGTYGVLDEEREHEVERPVAPSAVAVDTYGGYVFSSGADGVPFTSETARAFAEQRNEGLKIPTYKVFRLVPDEEA